MSDSPIIVALDYPQPRAAMEMSCRLDPQRCRVKVGKELFTRGGPQVVTDLVAAGFDVFLDLKFHDIPNTVAGACRAAMDLGVWMMNVHASGGRRMLAGARAALGEGPDRPLLVAVTLLTSLDGEDTAEIGLHGAPTDIVRNLATLTCDSGIDGVVCSPREILDVRAATTAEFLLVTPGIRPAGADMGDQKRVTTPADALAMGANYLVIGRPITGAADPMAALARIEEEIRPR